MDKAKGGKEFGIFGWKMSFFGKLKSEVWSSKMGDAEKKYQTVSSKKDAEFLATKN